MTGSNVASSVAGRVHHAGCLGVFTELSSICTQVNTGMVKLYQAEVLSKVPIMQHFLFGRLLEYPAG